MKGIVHLLGAVLLAPVLLAACAGQEFYEHLPFTEGVVQDYDLDASSRRRLQYFVSDDIHLVRVRGDGRRGVADGRLFDRSRQEIEEIVVTSGTPVRLAMTKAPAPISGGVSAPPTEATTSMAAASFGL